MTVDQESGRLHELTDEERAAKIQDLMDSEPLQMIQKSIEAFRRDLPELLEKHRGQWVGYHGDQRFGFGTDETVVYQEGFRQGLTRNDFIVGMVEPGAFDPDEEFEVTSWDV